MIKRQQRMQRIADVLQEYLAARTAASWLDGRTGADPNFGHQHGWEAKGGQAYSQNLESTYIIRMYSEFEAGLRDYWATYRGRETRPHMAILLRQSVPTPAFSQDCIDGADEVRIYRNFLVHDMADEPPTEMVILTLQQVKRRLCEYFGRINPRWQ